MQVTVQAQAVENCRAALMALERALNAPPIQASREADLAERQVVIARDAVIAARRANSDGDNASLSELLDRLNAALSLIVGVEYSMSGVERRLIGKARDAVKAVVEDAQG